MTAVRLSSLALLGVLSLAAPAHAEDAAPASGTAVAGETALQRYRKGWNPFSAGPELVSSADLQPTGQFFVRPYIYSEFGYAQFGHAWSFGTERLGNHLVAISPQVEFSYGLLDWLEFEAYLPEASWWQGAGDGVPAKDGHGIGDITAFLKARFLIQQPGTWWPSLTFVLFATLPTSSWFGPIGTPPIPGGFAPLGRLPSTHFGAPELTASLLFRKNVRPFRISGGLYYSYGLPSSSGGVPQDYGDIFQYRLAFEHFLDDSHGFAWALELVGIHGLAFRSDGRTVNAGKTDFALLGIQPSVEYAFTDHIVGAAGVLFTAAGRNDIAAVYPNLSLYYYWNPHGQVLAR